MLDVQHVSCGYGGQVILEDISFTLSRGELMFLLGPNGVGKTTLFRTLLGSLPKLSGKILLLQKDISSLELRKLARKLAYVPQAHTPPFPFRVIDVVTMGRTPHCCVFSSPAVRDTEIANETLTLLGIQHLRNKAYTEISGGERQLVLVARALAQQPDLLVMDEPTSNLDFGNQTRVLDHIQSIVQKQKISVILTTHSPNHALAYASKVAVIGRGRSFAVGNPETVISEGYLRDTYDVEAEMLGVRTRRGTTVRFCIPLSSKSAISKH